MCALAFSGGLLMWLVFADAIALGAVASRCRTGRAGPTPAELARPFDVRSHAGRPGPSTCAPIPDVPAFDVPGFPPASPSARRPIRAPPSACPVLPHASSGAADGLTKAKP